MAEDTNGIHLHTAAENNQWTERQEAVNMLMARTVGMDAMPALVRNPAVRAEVRSRLDQHDAEVAILEEKIVQARAGFKDSLKNYLQPIADKVLAEQANKVVGAHTKAAVAGKLTGLLGDSRVTLG